eukprot:1364088-Amphidinium_carterae.1
MVTQGDWAGTGLCNWDSGWVLWLICDRDVFVVDRTCGNQLQVDGGLAKCTGCCVDWSLVQESDRTV